MFVLFEDFAKNTRGTAVRKKPERWGGTVGGIAYMVFIGCTVAILQS
jgi:hypothetical protein